MSAKAYVEFKLSKPTEHVLYSLESCTI